MASSSSNFVNLKSKYDALVKKDEDINKEYNKILHTCLEQVLSDMRMRDATFGRLFREVYYGGSYFDRLAVGNLRHEFDLDIIFRVKLFFCCEMILAYILKIVFKGSRYCIRNHQPRPKE